MDLMLLSEIPAVSDASRQLATLLQRRREAAGAVAQTEAAQRRAREQLGEASDALSALEREAAVGDEPPPQERKRLEKQLQVAQARAGEAWAERIKGRRQATKATERAIVEHITHNLETLIAELEEDAHAASDALDEAARMLVARYEAREAVAGRLVAVVAATRPMKPNATYSSRAGEVVQAAQALLRVGERPPTLTFNPVTGESTAPVVPIGVGL
jgi:hypothetical protein